MPIFSPSPTPEAGHKTGSRYIIIKRFHRIACPGRANMNRFARARKVARSKSAASPPVMIISSPVRVLATPPDTGHLARAVLSLPARMPAGCWYPDGRRTYRQTGHLFRYPPGFHFHHNTAIRNHCEDISPANAAIEGQVEPGYRLARLIGSKPDTWVACSARRGAITLPILPSPINPVFIAPTCHYVV